MREKEGEEVGRRRRKGVPVQNGCVEMQALLNWLILHHASEVEIRVAVWFKTPNHSFIYSLMK